MAVSVAREKRTRRIFCMFLLKVLPGNLNMG